MTSFAAGGFAKGFATGFINERNRRLDEQKSQDEITLRYQLEALSKKRSDWEEQQKKDQEAIDAAKFVSKQINDPTFAPTALEYLKNGYSQSDVIQMYTNGNFKKKTSTNQTVDVPNPDVSANKLEVSKRVPPGVDMMQNQTSVQELQKMVPGATQVAIQDVQKTDNAVAQSPEIMDRLNRVNEKIDNIDPTLRQVANKPRIDVAQVLGEGADYEYVPDTKKEKLGTLADEMLKMEDAKRKGDVLNFERQSQRIEAIKKAEWWKANNKAKQEGKDIDNYAIIDKDGKLVSYVGVKQDDAGQNVNAATDKPITLSPGQSYVPVTEAQVKQGWDITEKFQKASEKYNVSAASVAEAVGISRKMVELSQRNRYVNTSTADALVTIQNFSEEVAAVQQVFQQWSNEGRQAADDNNPESFSASIANMTEQVKKIEERAVGLSDANAQAAFDKILFENYKILYAYKLAQANGQSSNGLSNKDLDRHLAMVGNTAGDSKALQAVLFNQLKQQISRNDVMQRQLNSDVDMWAGQLPFVPNIRAKRLGDLLTDPADIDFLNTVNRAKDQDMIYTNQKKQEADQQKRIPTLTDDEAGAQIYQNLPSGSLYIDPTGNQRRKP